MTKLKSRRYYPWARVGLSAHDDARCRRARMRAPHLLTPTDIAMGARFGRDNRAEERGCNVFHDCEDGLSLNFIVFNDVKNLLVGDQGMVCQFFAVLPGFLGARCNPFCNLEMGARFCRLEKELRAALHPPPLLFRRLGLVNIYRRLSLRFSR